MAVSLRNLERFFEQHPEHEARRTEVMAAARELSTGNAVSVGALKPVLDDLAIPFLREVGEDPDHHQIGREDLIRLSPLPNGRH